MSKTIIDDQRIQDLIDEIKEMKDKGVSNADYEKMGNLINELYDTYNPLDNDVDIRDGKVKWKVNPNMNLSKTKFEIELNKDIMDDDVTLMLNINGEASAFESKPGNRDFQVKAGFKIKY